MATKKAGGSTALGRDSQAKRLGVKIHDGEFAKSGAILVRQRGTRFFAGKNVLQGGDDTLNAMKAGFVKIRTMKKQDFTGKLRPVTYIDVLPERS